MKRSATVMSLVLLSVLQSFSQTIISGCVKFTNGEGVDMANVSVLPYSMPGTVIASTFTAVDGSFSIKVNSLCDSVVLKVSGMGLLPATVAVPNKQGTHTIVVEGRDMELKEVVVKAKKIYSQEDTINYNVASFLSQSDQSVADVLRKMPGITVSEAGQVSYQGKPIKNLYIEGLDLMKGHYGIATNSIDPNSIATVQVFENHQDIKALKELMLGILEDQPHLIA